MILAYEHKLYPAVAQAKTLDRWLRVCCAIYNRALEQRIKAYRRRGESVTYRQQQGLLTKQRARIEAMRLVPVVFEREYAGKHGVGVHAPGTSQECPWCGTVKAKLLSERFHQCDCRPGVVIDRDHASGMVIEARGLAATGSYCGGIDRCHGALCGVVSRPIETGILT
jgi:transposase